MVERSAVIDIRLLGRADRYVLDKVAADVFDYEIDPRWTAEFFEDPRHHIIVAVDAGLVIGITKTDLSRGFRMDSIRQAVRRCGPAIPVFTFDARDREQTTHLVRALLLTLD